jgi:hypothetical protein
LLEHRGIAGQLLVDPQTGRAIADQRVEPGESLEEGDQGIHQGVSRPQVDIFVRDDQRLLVAREAAVKIGGKNDPGRDDPDQRRPAFACGGEQHVPAGRGRNLDRTKRPEAALESPLSVGEHRNAHQAPGQPDQQDRPGEARRCLRQGAPQRRERRGRLADDRQDRSPVRLSRDRDEGEHRHQQRDDPQSIGGGEAEGAPRGQAQRQHQQDSDAAGQLRGRQRGEDISGHRAGFRSAA